MKLISPASQRGAPAPLPLRSARPATVLRARSTVHKLLCVLLLGTLAGCTNLDAQSIEGSSVNKQSSQRSSATAVITPTAPAFAHATPDPAATPVQTFVPCSAITFPTAAPALQTAVMAGTPQSQSAPSYWEIRHTIFCLMAKQPTPTPSRDRYPPDVVVDYMLYLRGMPFEGWQGWIQNVRPVKFGEDDYNVSVYLVIPREIGTGDDHRIISSESVGLASVTDEQVMKLKQHMDMHPEVRWHRVEFSGVIEGFLEDGQVFASKGKITIKEVQE